MPSFTNLDDFYRQFALGNLLLHPSESVFGLGCLAADELGIAHLTRFKQRAPQKGFILIVTHRRQLAPWMDISSLSSREWDEIEATPNSWVLPAFKQESHRLSGPYSGTLAVRFSQFPPLRQLIERFQQPWVSTSANSSGRMPFTKLEELPNSWRANPNLWIWAEVSCGKASQPSKIVNWLTKEVLRGAN